MVIYVFDGSLEGLMCAVFEYFERKPDGVLLKTSREHQPEAFTETFVIHNDHTKADRVWKGLQKRLSKGWIRKLYCCFLAETSQSYTSLFQLCTYLFTQPEGAENNYGQTDVLTVTQIARKVEREKHRMEAFIRFQHTADGIFYCGIDPDFNVLPLIMNHFKNRYADQQWIIYDIKRNYGLFYDLQQVEEIKMEFTAKKDMAKPAATLLSDEESLYAVLWKDYFKSANIPARKNTKLHIQHVPRRYWRYLTEKQI